ncbi:MAG: elongation factor P [Anaerolineaceae bacterium]|nr:elongation factor P [Anaerolineaceae bacterium]MCY3907707.1 elongation factor P [Anaerolineaceae bacterium]
MAIDVNQLRRGTTYSEDGELYRVLNYAHNKTGRGGATIRVLIRNLRSGAQVERTYNSGRRVDDIRVEAFEVEYLYDDGEFLTFMDTQTWDQPQMNRAIFGDDVRFLKANLPVKLLRYGEEVIDYELPGSVDFEVADSEVAVAGDTANNPTKLVTIETGLQVRVPLFVNVGDTIRVKTEDGSYVTRV